MVLIADTSPLISLIVSGKLNIIEEIFGEYYIPKGVWDELTSHNELSNYKDELKILSEKVKYTQSFFIEIGGIDKGETEAIVLYKELNADLLLIDDRKARKVAELLDVKCIGTLAVLFEAKEKGIVKELRTVFKLFIQKKRYFSKKILNELLKMSNENII